MIEFFCGFICGAMVFMYLGWRVHCRLLNRIAKHKGEELISHRLQSRRDVIESGIDYVVPDDAGPAAGEVSLFEIAPGTIALSQMKEKLPVDQSIDND